MSVLLPLALRQLRNEPDSFSAGSWRSEPPETFWSAAETERYNNTPLHPHHLDSFGALYSGPLQSNAPLGTVDGGCLHAGVRQEECAQREKRFIVYAYVYNVIVFKQTSKPSACFPGSDDCSASWHGHANRKN